jgi:hypothetical protein
MSGSKSSMPDPAATKASFDITDGVHHVHPLFLGKIWRPPFQQPDIFISTDSDEYFAKLRRSFEESNVTGVKQVVTTTDKNSSLRRHEHSNSLCFVEYRFL